MAEKIGRPAHIPRLNQTPDIGGGNPDALQKLLRHHGIRQAPLPAERGKGIRAPLPPVAKPEILSADEPSGAKAQDQVLQKRIPGGVLERPVKGQSHNGVHGVVHGQQKLPVLRRVNEPRGGAEDQSVRMIGEGHHPCPGAMFLCQIPAGPKQGLVADMHPVKKPQSIDCFVHRKPRKCL